jgi:hypothetical protein
MLTIVYFFLPWPLRFYVDFQIYEHYNMDTNYTYTWHDIRKTKHNYMNSQKIQY